MPDSRSGEAVGILQVNIRWAAKSEDAPKATDSSAAAGVRPRSGPASRRCLDQAWNNICETPGLWGERPRASLTKETREATERSRTQAV